MSHHIGSVLDCGNGASHVLLAEAIGELCSLKRFHLLNHILIHTLSVKFGLIAFFVILNKENKDRLRVLRVSVKLHVDNNYLLI